MGRYDVGGGGGAGPGHRIQIVIRDVHGRRLLTAREVSFPFFWVQTPYTNLSKSPPPQKKLLRGEMRLAWKQACLLGRLQASKRFAAGIIWRLFLGGRTATIRWELFGLMENHRMQTISYIFIRVRGKKNLGILSKTFKIVIVLKNEIFLNFRIHRFFIQLRYTP